MEALTFPLIASLLSHLGIGEILVLGQHGDSDSFLGENFDLVQGLSLGGFFFSAGKVDELDLGNRRALILSSSYLEGKYVSPANFYSNLFWVFPSTFDMESLPLRLDTNVLSYKEEGDGAIILEEFYKIKGGLMVQNHFGRWTPPDGLSIGEPNIWERRRDLRGTALINGMVPLTFPNPGFVYNMEDGTSVGALVDMLELLRTSLNFTTHDAFVPDNDYGLKGTDGTWTGIIGELKAGRYDMSNAGLTITPEREEAVDLTLGVFEDKVTLIIKNPVKYDEHLIHLDMTSFLSVFPPLVWCLILFQMCLYGLYCFVQAKADYVNGRSFESAQGFISGVSTHWLALLQLSSDSLNVLRTSGKLAYISIAASSVILFVFFTGDLTSFLTAGVAHKKIKTFEAYFKE